jgi:hypothetical protein
LSFLVQGGYSGSESRDNHDMRGVIGCLTFLFVMAALFLAAAWYGPPEGYGHWHGLRVQYSPDLIYTTGTVIRFEHAGTSSSQASTPVVEYTLNGRKTRFYGQGSNVHSFTRGDQVQIAYRKNDPETVYIRTFDQEFSVPLLMVLFSSPFLALALWGTYANIRERGPPANGRH